MANLREFLDGSVPESLKFTKAQSYVCHDAKIDLQSWLRKVKELVALPDEVRTEIQSHA
jgi:hypothetical protein